MNDESLAHATTPAEPATPFGNPDGTPLPHRQLTIEEVLESARRIEKVARISLRGDLAAEHDEVVRELASLVDTNGELIADPEASLDEQSTAARAQELNDRLTALGREMAGAMWSVRFRAMSSDEWAVFTKAHLPQPDKDGKQDLTEFNVKLIAATAIDPEISEDQVKALSAKLGSSQMVALANTAWSVCTKGGVDVPKSPLSLRNLTQQ